MFDFFVTSTLHVTASLYSLALEKVPKCWHGLREPLRPPQLSSDPLWQLPLDAGPAVAAIHQQDASVVLESNTRCNFFCVGKNEHEVEVPDIPHVFLLKQHCLMYTCRMSCISHASHEQKSRIQVHLLVPNGPPYGLIDCLHAEVLVVRLPGLGVSRGALEVAHLLLQLQRARVREGEADHHDATAEVVTGSNKKNTLQCVRGRMELKR